MTFERVQSLTDSQIDELTEMYQHEWWSGGRKREDVARMLENTAAVIAYVDGESGALAAFCRLLADGVYRAILLDVIVAREFRGRGLGRRLVEAIGDHPLTKDVKVIWLSCEPSLVPFYRRWGFDVIEDELTWMHKVTQWPS